MEPPLSCLAWLDRLCVPTRVSLLESPRRQVPPCRLCLGTEMVNASFSLNVLDSCQPLHSVLLTSLLRVCEGREKLLITTVKLGDSESEYPHVWVHLRSKTGLRQKKRLTFQSPFLQSALYPQYQIVSFVPLCVCFSFCSLFLGKYIFC